MNKFKVGDIVWVVMFGEEITIEMGVVCAITGVVVNNDYLSLSSITNAITVESVSIELIHQRDGKYKLANDWVAPQLKHIFCSKQEAVDYVKKMIEGL